jgi:SPX domain protein involved in polyphosphate accumulation
LSADTALTQARGEIKFLLSSAEASNFKSMLAEHLESHCFKKGKVITHISSVYFDTPNLDYYKKAKSSPQENLKIRFREYYYYNIELIEHALSKDELFEQGGAVFLEIKNRTPSGSSKKRLPISKSTLNQVLFENKDFVFFEKSLVKLNLGSEEKIFVEVFQSCFEKKIQPVVAVHYSRNAYENEEGTLRISLDKGLSFHSLQNESAVWRKGDSWRKDYLPESSQEEEFVVLEVKFIGDKPEWLNCILENYKQVQYSKFAACMKAVYDV